MTIPKLAIIIPAYNEEAVLMDTILSLEQIKSSIKAKIEIVVVNDGSTDGTSQLANKFADVVINHRQNCGLGASLATGIEYAKRYHHDYVITFDADGQHDPLDIVKVYRALIKGFDVVIGSRFKGSHSNMPKLRRYILALSNFVTYLFFGVWTSDSQSGFRGLNKRAIEQIALLSNRMEVSSEFFAEVRRRKLNFTEVPIHIRYTKYSMRKGQTHSASFNVLLKLLYLMER